MFEYDCGVVGKSIESLKILAFGENENVKIEITGNDSLIEGENEIKVKVTSEDGTTTKEYIIKGVGEYSKEDLKFRSSRDLDLETLANMNRIIRNLKELNQLKGD